MAYDAARQMIVLFGGTRKDTEKDTDTWAWDGRGWNRLNPTVSPPARSGASFAYHPPTETLVLFGGSSARGFLGDMWLWNGSIWTKVTGDGPPARVGSSMAFDPASGGLILFGGYGSGILDDTWVWNGKSWVRLSPQLSPPGRWGASLAYHSGMGKLILFGGKARVLGGPEPEETWAWDGTNWSQLSLNRLPPWRLGASMAEADGEVLLFGGMVPASNAIGWSYLGDTWLLGSTWSEVTQAPAPPPRALASLAAYPPRNSLLLFGGASAPGRLLDDTWMW
jgi:Galactose oxidase, central domain